MWILTVSTNVENLHLGGPFFLPAGCSFTVGRKGADLLIKLADVSRHAGTFVVDDSNQLCYDDKSKIETKVNGVKASALKLDRAAAGDTDTALLRLQTGDELALGASVKLTVDWRPTCVWFDAGVAGERELSSAAKDQGLNVVSLNEAAASAAAAAAAVAVAGSTDDVIRVVVADQLTSSLAVGLALAVGAAIVDPSWLSTLLGGNSDAPAVVGMRSVPEYEKHRPALDPSLDGVVEPDWFQPTTQRRSLFRGQTFQVKQGEGAGNVVKCVIEAAGGSVSADAANDDNVIIVDSKHVPVQQLIVCLLQMKKVEQAAAAAAAAPVKQVVEKKKEKKKKPLLTAESFSNSASFRAAADDDQQQQEQTKKRKRKVDDFGIDGAAEQGAPTKPAPPEVLKLAASKCEEPMIGEAATTTGAVAAAAHPPASTGWLSLPSAKKKRISSAAAAAAAGGGNPVNVKQFRRRTSNSSSSSIEATSFVAASEMAREPGTAAAAADAEFEKKLKKQAPKQQWLEQQQQDQQREAEQKKLADDLFNDNNNNNNNSMARYLKRKQPTKKKRDL